MTDLTDPMFHDDDAARAHFESTFGQMVHSAPIAEPLKG